MERGARIRGPIWKGAVFAKPISAQNLIDVDHMTLAGPARVVASSLVQTWDSKLESVCLGGGGGGGPGGGARLGGRGGGVGLVRARVTRITLHFTSTAPYASRH